MDEGVFFAASRHDTNLMDAFHNILIFRFEEDDCTAALLYIYFPLSSSSASFLFENSSQMGRFGQNPAFYLLCLDGSSLSLFCFVVGLVWLHVEYTH